MISTESVIEKKMSTVLRFSSPYVSDYAQNKYLCTPYAQPC